MTTIEEARRIVELADKVATLDTKIDERQLSLKLLHEDRHNAQIELDKLLTPHPFKVGDTVGLASKEAGKFIVTELEPDRAKLQGALSDIVYGWYHISLLRRV